MYKLQFYTYLYTYFYLDVMQNSESG